MRTTLLLILIGSAGFALWTWASPPEGALGISNGALYADTSGNIGIKTTAPVTALDVNGAATIRGILSMANNRITNLLTPAAGTDAATKAYVDSLSSGVSISGLPGQGRPGATTVTGTACGNTAECYKDLNTSGSCNTGDVKIARSANTATWGGAAAACPANWWVCSGADRDITAGSAGYGSCGTVTRTVIGCFTGSTYTDEYFTSTNANLIRSGWIANVSATANNDYAKIVNIGGTLTSGVDYENYSCSLMPVWCCSYQ